MSEGDLSNFIVLSFALTSRFILKQLGYSLSIFSGAGVDATDIFGNFETRINAMLPIFDISKFAHACQRCHGNRNHKITTMAMIIFS